MSPECASLLQENSNQTHTLKTYFLSAYLQGNCIKLSHRPVSSNKMIYFEFRVQNMILKYKMCIITQNNLKLNLSVNWFHNMGIKRHQPRGF